MSTTRIEAEKFLNRARDQPVLDVRSPSEYAAGHIPGALSLPLFDDMERAAVGTAYKQQGQQQAISLGLNYVSPKLGMFLKKAESLAGRHGKLLLYCWRGGMRSDSVAWFLRLAGFETSTLYGGYKAFRAWGATLPKKLKRPVVLCGPTGVGKTKVLRALQENGSQILDLEYLANHKGSTFGALGMPAQPTQAQFENRLTYHLSQLKLNEPVWLEDESRTIGRRVVPEPLWQKMAAAPGVTLSAGAAWRAAQLAEEYGIHSIPALREAVLRISKRLGGLATKQALEALEQGSLQKVASLMLAYYDKAYESSQSARKINILTVDVENNPIDVTVNKLQALLVVGKRRLST